MIVHPVAGRRNRWLEEQTVLGHALQKPRGLLPAPPCYPAPSPSTPARKPLGSPPWTQVHPLSVMESPQIASHLPASQPRGLRRLEQHKPLKMRVLGLLLEGLGRGQAPARQRQSKHLESFRAIVQALGRTSPAFNTPTSEHGKMPLRVLMPELHQYPRGIFPPSADGVLSAAMLWMLELVHDPLRNESPRCLDWR